MGDDTKEYHALVLQLINPEQVGAYDKFDCILISWQLICIIHVNTEGNSTVGAEQEERIVS